MEREKEKEREREKRSERRMLLRRCRCDLLTPIGITQGVLCLASPLHHMLCCDRVGRCRCPANIRYVTESLQAANQTIWSSSGGRLPGRRLESPSRGVTSCIKYQAKTLKLQRWATGPFPEPVVKNSATASACMNQCSLIYIYVSRMSSTSSFQVQLSSEFQ